MNKLLFILGATASGKSKIALNLAQKLNTDIISADAYQIYKELDIGTAKPTKAELATVKHHMVDIISADDTFNSFEFVKRVKILIDEMLTKNKTPLIVGGTGLFVDSLIYGLDNIDAVDNNIRKSLIEQSTIDSDELYRKLQYLDPIKASSIHPNNTRAVIRALEILLSNNGDTITPTRRLVDKKPLYNFTIIILNKPRDELYEDINKRVDKMIDFGLIEEVKSLTNKYGWNIQSMQAIGYKELNDYFTHSISIVQCVEQIKQHTRNYAKRQITYFKRMNNAVWLDATVSEDVLTKQILMEYAKGE